MCGIIGYVGHQQAAPILLDGLARMEYRGYDSAGVAVRSETKGLQVYKSKGRLQVLSDMIHGGADVEELLAAGLVVDLVDSRNDLFEGIEELMAEILPGVSAAAGSSREGPGMPFLRGKRSLKRKKA